MSRPWMPLYVADYLADTMHLSTVEHGAYMLLIMHYWQNGSLPKEPVKLARIARMTGKEWAEISDTIAELFQEDWTHKRIDSELAEAQAKYEKRSNAAAAAAGKRWGNPADRKPRSERLAEARQKGTHTELEWQVLQDLFDACVKCEIKRGALHGEAFCKDHITPIYQGGDDSIDNLQPMCRACNSRKAQEIVDYRDQRLPGWRKMFAERLQAASQPQTQINAGMHAEMNAKRIPNASLTRGNSQPQSQPQNPHQSSEPVGRSDDDDFDHDRLLDRLCEAAGITGDQRFPGLQVTGPITDMIEAGWSLDRHILPKIRAMREEGRRGNSWAYYAKSIKGSAAAPPKSEPPPAEPPRETFRQKRERIWSQQLAAARRLGAWSDHWGAPPGSPACEIPPEFVAAWEAANPQSGAAA